MYRQTRSVRSIEGSTTELDSTLPNQHQNLLFKFNFREFSMQKPKTHGNDHEKNKLRKRFSFSV